MYKKNLTYVILILLLFSTITSISFGKNSEITEQNKLLEDLSFYCTTPNGFNEVKFEYYKKQLSKQDSDDDTKEHLISNSAELITTPNTPLITGLSNGPMDSAWPMKCHDLHHTGLSPYSTADNPYDIKWSFYTDGWIEDSPVIDSDGTIYFGGDYGGLPWYLIAINPDGTLKWRFKTDGLILGSSPAIDENGTIYVGSWDSYLYAIYPNGTLKWKFSTNGANIFSSPAIDEDGIIYFGDLGDFGYNSKIYAVNPNGTEKWHYTINNRIYSDPCIGDDGTIYIGSDDTYLYAMNPDGTLKWRFKTGDVIKAPPSIADDSTIYIGSYDDYLYALYPNGTMKWKCPIGYGTALNPSIAGDGTIYVGWDYLYAVYLNGTIKWIFNMGENRHNDGSSPAISADGTIYFGTDIGDGAGGEIIAVNPDGTERWRKKIANYWVDSSPCIAEDGTVYIGSAYNIDTGYLYAFGVKDLEADANGPYYGLINEPLQFTGSSSGGYYPHSYHWDFGDTQTSEEQNPIHTYTNSGNYTVTLTVTDNTSNTTSDISWAWIQENNTPPNKPTIDGPINGNVKTSYPYVVSASDPDESNIWYYIDWGDNTNTDWIGPYDSGTEITRSHSWNKKGTYIIKVKAKDPYNSESLEATLEVTMPKNRASLNSLLLRFLERFLLLQKLLNFKIFSYSAILHIY